MIRPGVVWQISPGVIILFPKMWVGSQQHAKNLPEINNSGFFKKGVEEIFYLKILGLQLGHGHVVYEFKKMLQNSPLDARPGLT